MTGRQSYRTSKPFPGAATIAHTVRFAYDALGAVSAIQIDDAAPMTLTRDAHGRIQVEHLDAELRHELSYVGRAARQTKLLNDTGALFASEYLYDANGQLIEKRDSRLGVERYQYDPVGRLTGHLDPTGSCIDSCPIRPATDAHPQGKTDRCVRPRTTGRHMDSGRQTRRLLLRIRHGRASIAETGSATESKATMEQRRTVDRDVSGELGQWHVEHSHMLRI